MLHTSPAAARVHLLDSQLFNRMPVTQLDKLGIRVEHMYTIVYSKHQRLFRSDTYSISQTISTDGASLCWSEDTTSEYSVVNIHAYVHTSIVMC